nr:alpha/beta hydrolase [uncultured Glaciecola sp.]
MTHLIKTPVVFFPGTVCDERIFIPLWQALNANGNSLDNKAFVPLQWADDLQQMLALSADRLAYFPSKVHLVGFSMGGYIAALIALAHPEKVASLTLLSCTARVLKNEDLQQRKILLDAIKNKQYKGMTQSHIEFMLHSKHHANAALTGIIKEMADDLGPSVLSAQTNATANRKDLIKKLSKQTFKTHFVIGEQDNIATVSEINDITASSSSLLKDVIIDAGHMLPLEQPDALANYLHFTLQ